MTENGSLSPKQSRTIAALLTSRTIEDAAHAAGVSERQLYRWLRTPAFRDALREAESASIDAAGRRLLAGQDAALDALEDLLTRPGVSDANRRQAAVHWLDYVLKWRELNDIERRLAELEAKLL